MSRLRKQASRVRAVTPAKAGVQGARRLKRSRTDRTNRTHVTPAKAGVQGPAVETAATPAKPASAGSAWIPASAGMTCHLASWRPNEKSKREMTNRSWIPGIAGMTWPCVPHIQFCNTLIAEGGSERVNPPGITANRYLQMSTGCSPARRISSTVLPSTASTTAV